MREIVYELGGFWQGYELIFIAKRKIAFSSHREVLNDFKKQLTKVGVLSNE